MSIRFSCPCGQKFKTHDGTRGRRTRCTNCLSLLIVPPKGSSSYETVAELYHLKDSDDLNAPPKLPSPAWSPRRMALLIGGVLLFVAVVVTLVIANKRKAADENTLSATATAATSTAEVRDFAEQFLDKKVGRTLPDIVHRANAVGVSTENAYNLILDATSAGLVQIDPAASGKPSLYRLK